MGGKGGFILITYFYTFPNNNINILIKQLIWNGY